MTIKKKQLDRRNALLRVPKTAVERWFAPYAKNKIKLNINVILNDDGSIVIRPE